MVTLPVIPMVVIPHHLRSGIIFMAIGRTKALQTIRTFLEKLMMLCLLIMKEPQLPQLVLVTTLESEALKDVDVDLTAVAAAATIVEVLARSMDMDMDTLPSPLSMLALLAVEVAFQATAGLSMVMDLTLANVEAHSTLLPLHS
jgi:hypothetical protein